MRLTMESTTDTAAPPSDRRRALRRQPAQGTICKLLSDTGESPALGLVWNISLSGVSMLLGSPLKPGTQIKGELQAADGLVSLGMAIKVAHLSKLATGDYFVGAQFEQPITEQQLQQFVGT